MLDVTVNILKLGCLTWKSKYPPALEKVGRRRDSLGRNVAHRLEQSSHCCPATPIPVRWHMVPTAPTTPCPLMLVTNAPLPPPLLQPLISDKCSSYSWKLEKEFQRGKSDLLRVTKLISSMLTLWKRPPDSKRSILCIHTHSQACGEVGFWVPLRKPHQNFLDYNLLYRLKCPKSATCHLFTPSHN